MEETLPQSLTQRDREEARIREEIQEGLRGIVDPGTGLDVVRMGLVKNTQLEKAGAGGYKAILTFRPTSPVCPMAFKLAWDMKQCVQALDEIGIVEIKVEGYNRAAELEAILREEEKA
jgi:metal-sulfur cluster biosynthetic enzyme